MTRMIQDTTGNVKGQRVRGRSRTTARGRLCRAYSPVIEDMRRRLDFNNSGELATKIRRYWDPYNMTAADYMQVFADLTDGEQAGLRNIVSSYGFQVEALEFLFPLTIALITK